MSSEHLLPELAALRDKAPEPIEIDPKWLDINSIDADNLRWHLENTPSQQAWIAQAVAEAEYWHNTYADLASAREARVFMLFKTNSYERRLAKGATLKVDASDEVSKMAAKADILACRYRELDNQWRARRDLYRGWMAAFETKKMFVAALSGLRREEMSTLNHMGRSQG